jgi:hypothetical protein
VLSRHGSRQAKPSACSVTGGFAVLAQKAEGAGRRVILHPTLLGELGVATVLAGGVLAYRAHLKNRTTLQTTAGLLLITGFACLGVAISFIVGSPLR